MTGLYLEQWPIESMTGRTDENGRPKVYTISETQEHTFQCSCGAWTFQRKKLFNGRIVNPDYDTVNGKCKHIMWVQEHYRSFNVDDARRAVREGRSFVIADNEYRMTVPCGRIAGMLSRMDFSSEVKTKVIVISISEEAQRMLDEKVEKFGEELKKRAQNIAKKKKQKYTEAADVDEALAEMKKEGLAP